MEIDSASFHFCRQASDPIFLSALMLGQVSKQGLEKLLAPFFSSAIKPSYFWLKSAQSFSIASEAFAFEWSLRSLKIRFEAASPHLLSWDGKNGLREGLIYSGLSFFALHNIGKIGQGTNNFLQQGLQAAGVVGIHNIASRLDLMAPSSFSIPVQFFEAAAFNLQQQGVAQLGATHFSPLAKENFSRAEFTPAKTDARFSYLKASSPKALHSVEDFQHIFEESNWHFELGMLRASEATDIYIAAYNLRLSTSGEKPFLMDESVRLKLQMNFEDVRKAAQKIQELDDYFSQCLFANRDPNTTLSELLAMKSEMASKAKTLEKRWVEWEEALHPALETIHLNLEDHQQVGGLIARYNSVDKKAQREELLPYRRVSPPLQDENLSLNIANLPGALPEKVARFYRGFLAEDSAASRLFNQAMSQYVESINKWLEVNPQRDYSFPINALENLLFDTHTLLKFMRDRQSEHEQILFELKRHGISQPAWYQSLHAQFQFSLNEKIAGLSLLESKLMPLLKRPRFGAEEYRLVHNILALFQTKVPGLPRLNPYPPFQSY